MKILLNGYFHKNFGDDLFFHMIRERYNQHMFYVPIESESSSEYVGEKNVREQTTTIDKKSEKCVFILENMFRWIGR